VGSGQSEMRFLSSNATTSGERCALATSTL
jgi:hypothetical protein